MKRFFIFFILGLCSLKLFAQEITYSKPAHDDVLYYPYRGMEVIGKFNNNLLVYKHIRHKYFISIYDDQMKLKECEL